MAWSHRRGGYGRGKTVSKHALRRGAYASLVILAAGLAACGDAPAGTGQLKALYIHPPGYMVATGLRTRIEIPDRRYYPDGANRNSMSRMDSWNFNDATVEVDAPPGFDFEVITVKAPEESAEAEDFFERHDSGGFILRTECNAEPSYAHEVRVRVKKGAEVRYEDVLSLACHDPTRLRFLGLTPGRYFVGGRVLAEARLTVATALGSTPLGGEGLTLADRKGLLHIETSSLVARTHIALLEVVNAGSEPEISYLNARARLPIEAVEDDNWTIELGTPQPDMEGPNVSRWTLPVRAIGSDPERSELLGLHSCFWELSWGDSNTVSMSGCLATVPSAPKRACVWALGKTACRDFP